MSGSQGSCGPLLRLEAIGFFSDRPASFFCQLLCRLTAVMDIVVCRTAKATRGSLNPLARKGLALQERALFHQVESIQDPAGGPGFGLNRFDHLDGVLKILRRHIPLGGHRHFVGGSEESAVLATNARFLERLDHLPVLAPDFIRAGGQKVVAEEQ